jgi:hypothetical protein
VEMAQSVEMISLLKRTSSMAGVFDCKRCSNDVFPTIVPIWTWRWRIPVEKLMTHTRTIRPDIKRVLL